MSDYNAIAVCAFQLAKLNSLLRGSDKGIDLFK